MDFETKSQRILTILSSQECHTLNLPCHNFITSYNLITVLSSLQHRFPVMLIFYTQILRQQKQTLSTATLDLDRQGKALIKVAVCNHISVCLYTSKGVCVFVCVRAIVNAALRVTA